jgi:hypothetical protein
MDAFLISLEEQDCAFPFKNVRRENGRAGQNISLQTQSYRTLATQGGTIPIPQLISTLSGKI